MGLHTPLHFVVVEVLAFMNVGLPDKVQSSIVQVFGGKRRCIDDAVAWITPANHVLLNELHGCCPLSAWNISSCISLLSHPRQKDYVLTTFNRGLLSLLCRDCLRCERLRSYAFNEATVIRCSFKAAVFNVPLLRN